MSDQIPTSNKTMKGMQRIEINTKGNQPGFTHTASTEGVGKTGSMTLSNPGTGPVEGSNTPSEKTGRDSAPGWVARNKNKIDLDDRIR